MIAFHFQLASGDRFLLQAWRQRLGDVFGASSLEFRAHIAELKLRVVVAKASPYID